MAYGGVEVVEGGAVVAAGGGVSDLEGDADLVPAVAVFLAELEDGELAVGEDLAGQDPDVVGEGECAQRWA
jgi:hypothetical protein